MSGFAENSKGLLMLITRDSQESKAQGDEGQTRAGKRRDAQQGAQQAWNIRTL